MLHDWHVSPSEAMQIQQDLRHNLILDKAPETVNTIAGIDVSFSRGSKVLYAAIVLLDLSQAIFTKNGQRIAGFTVLETATASLEVDFPYIPGLLSFREVPVILKAWKHLSRRPDCLMCDGQGIAHPRRFGLAAHLGLILDLPAIGCGKSRLIGDYQEPGPNRGDVADLIDKNEWIGAILRTRTGVKPVFISQGHRMTLERALEITSASLGRFRLPEPTRIAHQHVNEARLEGVA